jgi:hypothetical protein
MNLKQFQAILFWGIQIILLLGCGASTSTPQSSSNNPIQDNSPVAAVNPTSVADDSPTADIEYDANDPGLNLLVSVDGDVLLKRRNWNDFYPTAFGVSLQRGDLLKVPQGAQATILCDNLNTWTVPAGAAPSGLSGCPRPEEPFLVRQGGRIVSTRGGDPNVPYIISPRSTKLLSDTPTLRWNDSGAASYYVLVRASDFKWQQVNVTQTELVYSGEPALQPGVFYLLVVEDSNGKSSQDEGQVGLGFSLLNEAEAKKIQSNADRIGRLGLSNEAEAFSVAQIYAGNSLITEAIEILEMLVEEGSQQASVHQVLASLYHQVGLLLLAEPRYLEAIELAKAQDNIEALADIQASLGALYDVLGKEAEAIRLLASAETDYRTLGDTDKANRIADQLGELR